MMDTGRKDTTRRIGLAPRLTGGLPRDIIAMLEKAVQRFCSTCLFPEESDTPLS
jgi:hypothetical protein